VWWIDGPVVGGVASKTGAMTLSVRIRRGSPVIGLARQDESGSPEIIGRYKMHFYAGHYWHGSRASTTALGKFNLDISGARFWFETFAM
jgi:hypothetical protein